jgi:hypothetical protein
MYDSIYGANATLLYSREIPTKSMEILGHAFNNKKNGEEVRWLRIELVQFPECMKIYVMSTDPTQNDFMYSSTVDAEAFCRIQKEQSIRICSNDFPKRLSTLLDYCLLQMHCNCSQESRFCCVFNEHETDASQYKLYITEQNEFKSLVHLILDFDQVSAINRSEMHYSASLIKEHLL